MTRTSQRSFRLLLVVATMFLCSCRENRDMQNQRPDSTVGLPAPSESAPSASPFEPQTIRDRLGREIVISKVPERIVSLSPSTTELLFALGLGSKIVGATKHCDYPAEALAIPRVGSGTLEGISREAILDVQPDLILCKWDNHQPLVETFEKLGIPIVGLGPERLEELFDEARLLGRITGQNEQADRLVDSMKSKLAMLLQRVESINDDKQLRVFYEVWDKPLMTAGPQSFIGELLQLARCKNIFDDVTLRYPKVSMEALIDRDPEVILCPTTHGRPVEIPGVLQRAGWESISAIRSKRVYLIDGDQVSRCGPRLLDALSQMMDAVYPESKRATDVP
jgi:iron complex transport system substrate-binding protein